MLSVAESCRQTVGVEDRANLWLDPGQAKRDAVRPGDLGELGELRRALRVDEVDALEVEDERAWSGGTLLADDRADAIVERLGGREEQAAVEAQHGDPRERLVAGVLVELAERLCARLAAQERHARRGRDVDRAR